MKWFQYKDFIFSFNPTWIVFLWCILNLLFMHYYFIMTGCLEVDAGFTIYVDNILGVYLDIAVLFWIAYIVLMKSPRFTLIIIFMITLCWSFSNVLYSRFFHHYISLSAIAQSDALFDGQIVRCLIDGLRWIDLYYLFSICSFCFLISRTRPLVNPIFKSLFFLFIMIVIDILSYLIFCVQIPEYRYFDYVCQRFENRQLSTFLQLCDPNHSTFRRGCARAIMYELFLDMKGNIEMNEERRRLIEFEIDKSKRCISHKFQCADDLNVIFILVESYMSFVSDMKVGNQEVTPFLNSLKHDSKNYFNGKMHENVTIGESSDGQFIYMTGLLPLRSVITVSKARNITLLGLPKLLHRESRMIIPTVASMWLQDEMCSQYGFDNLYTSKDFKDGINTNLNDEQVFQLAIEKDLHTNNPFFSVILTMSMHQPYTKQIDMTFPITDSSMPQDLACYLNACHYTDRQINKYFNHLRKTGLYDNSLIVVAADHPVHNSDFGGKNKEIPLYIIGENVKQEMMWKKDCFQIDVYSTILDILGIDTNWYGLGNSLVSSEYEYSLSEDKWNASEWIIRSNYLEKLN